MKAAIDKKAKTKGRRKSSTQRLYDSIRAQFFDMTREDGAKKMKPCAAIKELADKYDKKYNTISDIIYRKD